MLASPGREATAPEDVQATLAELTARIGQRCAEVAICQTRERLLVCGGGAFNGHLLRRLASLLPRIVVQTTTEIGLPADQVEAVAFAWLARAFVDARRAIVLR